MGDATMRSTIQMSGRRLKDENVKIVGNKIKVKYAITRSLMKDVVKEKLRERGRIDEVLRLPVMATECYWDDLSGKQLDPS